MKHDLASLKIALQIPDVWRILRLPGEPKPSCHSPIRKDQKASFSVYQDGNRWKDFATGEGGDVIDFVGHVLNVDRAEAVRRFIEMAGGASSAPLPTRLTPARQERRLALPSARLPTASEIEAIALSRGLSVRGVAAAAQLGVLFVDDICGHRSWILTDAALKLAEARRLDGQLYPALGRLSERKAHTIGGSRKTWPVGAALLREKGSNIRVMVVEGGPDFLAAVHCICSAGRFDVVPVGILGRTAGTRLDPEAMEWIRGHPVRIYPHLDPDGGGYQRARRWAQQFHDAACKVDLFRFDGLLRADGQPVGDLNDAVLVRGEDQHQLEGLLP